MGVGVAPTTPATASPMRAGPTATAGPLGAGASVDATVTAMPQVTALHGTAGSEAEVHPPHCNAEAVTGLITRFFDAFNRGDQTALARFFPAQAAGAMSNGQRTQFQWYSVTEGNPQAGGNNFTARNLDELLAYFARRHGQHERLELRSLQINGRGWHGGIDFQYALTRAANDLPARVVEGKGSINCDDQTIFVWSMGNN